jgi:hypothetical protein
MLMDADALSYGTFPADLQRICRERNIRSMLYYPVDAPLQPPWNIIDSVNVAVTFTEYGRAGTRKGVRL